jgi:ElaB/YqjD/DUF883 family membrane-anchored ribosome-binding protein
MQYETTEGQSQGATDALKDQAQQVTDKATDKAKEVGGTVQDRMKEQVDSRSTQAGDQVSSVGQAMRDMGDQLRSQGNDLPAQLAQQAAERAEQLGQYLREADADRILRDVEDFGRRQPWVMAAVGLAAGVAAARFLKASSRRRYESGGDGGYRGYESGYTGRSTYPESSLTTGDYGSTGYGTAGGGAATGAGTGETWSSGSLTPEDTLGTTTGAFPSEPVEVTPRVDEAEGGTYPLRGSE